MLAVVECVVCRQQAFVRDSYQSGQYTCLTLSCGCENVLCPTCDKPSSNVTYAEGEYFLLCDECDKDSGGFDFPEEPETEETFQFQQRSRYVSPTWRKMNRAYSLDDLRKEHPRAYLKWTEDEKIALFTLRNQGKTSAELDAIFLRQPGVTRLPESERFVPDSAAIYLLGEKITCDVCQHEAILTYLHLEKVAEYLKLKVLDMSKEMLLGVIKASFKCTQCKSKSVTIENDLA
jgi:hypothetical protein